MKKENIKKVVLAYSGGLDTSIIIPWLKENYNNCEVVAVSGDVGQGTELDGLEEKAKATGASKLYVLDLKKDFVENYIFPTLKFGANNYTPPRGWCIAFSEGSSPEGCDFPQSWSAPNHTGDATPSPLRFGRCRANVHWTFCTPALATASYPFVDLPSGDTLRCKLFPSDKFHKIRYLFDR